MPRSLPARLLSRKRRFPTCWLVAAAVAASAATCRPAAAITIQFNYDYDVGGFFGAASAPTAARVALEFAGRAYETFTDQLAAIQPGGSNTWTARFINPATGVLTSVPNLSAPQDTVIVFAGARDLESTRLGEGGFGGFVLGPGVSPSFQSAVVNRNQGAATQDFAPWGGAIVFDTAQSNGDPRQWHFDLNSPPAPGLFDFYSVAVHELAHLMGFGTSSAFTAHLTGNETTGYRFDGPATNALNQGSAALAGTGHWASGTTSPPFVVGAPKPSLGPSLAFGERKPLTPLDYAALADTGWSVPAPLLGLTGDVDADADVDGADYLAWQRNLGGLGGAPGDVDGNLRVDALDGWLIRQFLGGQGAGAIVPPATATVPEPAAAALAATALAAWLVLRRGPRGSGRRRRTA